MQYKVLVVSALATLAAATPARRAPSQQCCTTVTTSSDPAAQKAAGLININISNINVPIGLTCVPITVIGGGAAGCNQEAVTCDSVFGGGLLGIGCLPINLRRTETPPPPPPPTGPPTQQCCTAVTTSSDPAAQKAAGLVNINISNINVPIGLTCVPISVIGGGAAGCNTNAVTCDSVFGGGLLGIGCLPINLRRTETPPPPPPTTTPSNQCCTSVTSSSDPSAKAIAGLLNINISNINVPIGLNCVPITVIGGGAAGCNSNSVTCDSVFGGGLLGIGCLPINLRRTETPPPPPPSTPSQQCCKSTTTAGDPGAQAILGLLNINVSDINVPVGLNCVPITVVGGGAAGCNDEALTCEAADKSWLGLIAIGCLPIDF